MRKIKWGILLLAVVALAACANKQKKEKESGEGLRVKNTLFSFDFTLDDKSIADRVLFLDSIGFEGVTFSVRNEKDLVKLRNYQETLELAKNKNFVTTQQYK